MEDIMKQRPIKITVEKLKTPIVYSNSEVAHYKGEITFKGYARTFACKTFKEVLEFISKNSSWTPESWESVTGNGKYSCD